MDRRDFLKTTGTAMAVAAVTPTVVASAEAAAKAKPVRAVLPINRRWRYSPKATPAAHEHTFDDSKFDRVTVPHTNIRLPWHSFDEKAYEFIADTSRCCLRRMAAVCLWTLKA